jgi:hypothetical protein
MIHDTRAVLYYGTFSTYQVHDKFRKAEFGGKALNLRVTWKPGMIDHAVIPATQEAETGGSWIKVCLGKNSEILPFISTNRLGMMVHAGGLNCIRKTIEETQALNSNPTAAKKPMETIIFLLSLVKQTICSSKHLQCCAVNMDLERPRLESQLHHLSV